MIQTLSHTFNFQTIDTSKEHEFLENILYITEEDESKHYIQYIQYWTENYKIFSREVSIKVDRNYYLEIANINIDDLTRRRHFFSILGQRRLGANNKNIDYYLINDKFDTQKFHEAYNEANKDAEKISTYIERNKTSVNSFKFFDMQIDDTHIIYLEQFNHKKRKRLKKIYVLELSSTNYEHYKNIQSVKTKISYIFSEIGKIYFKSLEVTVGAINHQDANVEELAKAKLKKSNFEKERASRINNNSVFRTLKENSEKIEDMYFNLYTKTHDMMMQHDNEGSIHLFSVAVVQFTILTKEIKELEEIIAYLTTLQMLAESGTLSYLFTQHDPDFRDIFLYMLESFSAWNFHLTSSIEDIRAFNKATVDYHDALRHLIDMSFRFKHDYRCQEIEHKVEDTKKERIIQEQQHNVEHADVTSSEEYFMEIEIDCDAYDELHELEIEINELPCLDTYDEKINERLIRFFYGYTHVLNPLFEFKDLSYSLMILAQKLEVLEIQQNNEMLLVLMQGLVSDLLLWKKTVLVEKTAPDIHYMNQSFYSNIAQIEILMEDAEREFEDADIFF